MGSIRTNVSGPRSVFWTTLIGLDLSSTGAPNWLPRLSTKVLELAAGRFRDPSLAERLLEEWKGAIADIPGGLTALIHSASLFARVRRLERSYASATSSSDVDKRFSELGQTMRDFSDSFGAALSRRGVTLEDVARVTKVSIRDLTALMRGDLGKIRIGYQTIFAFMPELTKLLGSDCVDIKARYVILLRKSGGLPPADVARGRQRLIRVWCALIGHRARSEFIHSSIEFPFHWSFRRCNRCGDVSVMQAEPCRGVKIRRKVDIDRPAEDRYECEMGERRTYRSLDSVAPTVALRRTLELTPVHLTAFTKDDQH